jgi:hypothetical protein
MKASARKSLVVYLILIFFGLPFLYFFAHPVKFWLYAGMLVMGGICLIIVAVKQRLDASRYGPRMTFEEIIQVKDPDRCVQLLRYHLGWSPGKIALELNNLQIRNHGLPWREHDVEAIIKGIVGPL